MLTGTCLCKILRAQGFSKDGDQVKHSLQYFFLGPHLITGTLLVKEFNKQFFYLF